jgi:hypothetical protein
MSHGNSAQNENVGKKMKLKEELTENSVLICFYPFHTCWAWASIAKIDGP